MRPALQLTFDDGPDPTWTPAVLEVLERHQATAMFFVLGERVRRHPELVEQIRRAGHQIGLHGDAHLDHRTSSAAELRDDTARSMQTLAEVGEVPTAWRLPWGRPGATSSALAAKHDLTVIGWDADTHDWRGDGWAQQGAVVHQAAGRGGIVLLHDGLGPGALRDGCANTIELTERLATAATEHGVPLRWTGPPA